MRAESGWMVGKRIISKLSLKLLAGLGGGLVISSLLFLALLAQLYTTRLAEELESASVQVNRLLQVSLENAMLKRDLPGLRQIVARLGTQPGVVRVRIINPRRVVRFASRPRDLDATLAMADLGCPDCAVDVERLAAMKGFLTTDHETGGEVLRSVNPIHNRQPCSVCHGPVAEHPINGVLVVDHDASGLRRQAWQSVAMLVGAGLTIVCFALVGTWLFLRRAVIAPVTALSTAARAIAGGDLSARSKTHNPGRDELAELCEAFNAMAAALEENVEAICEAEAFLQNLIDSVPEGIRVINEDYRVVRVNRAYAEQMGAEPQALIGRACFEAHGRSSPCPPTLITCPFDTLGLGLGLGLGPGETTTKYIHRHIGAAGLEFQVEIVAARLEARVDGRRCTLIIEAIRDLADSIKISQEQRLAELGQLATGVAHEIYNPLASVKLGLQAILRKMAREPGDAQSSGAEIKRYMTTVDGEVDKCIEITRRLLSLSLPPSRNLQLISFTTIIPDVISLLRYEAESIGVGLDIDLGEADLRVLARDSELRMLILNLVQNAFHAMPGGGRLQLCGRVAKDEIEIVISDTGVGIAPEDLSRIFDPFFSRRADHVEGTGLGLTICNAIVARYDGRLEVQSMLGKGTTFTIVMAMASEAKSVRPVRDAAGHAGNRSTRTRNGPRRQSVGSDKEQNGAHDPAGER